MNGKTVEIDNTDCEGRLVLCDALYYTLTTCKPHTIIDVATLTYGVGVALGKIFTGAYADSDDLWHELQAAGEYEFDRFWRLPLDDAYMPMISGERTNADIMNCGGPMASSVTAAMFLKSFVDSAKEAVGDETPARWAHLDIAAVVEAEEASPYMGPGMTGRPVRRVSFSSLRY